MIWLRALLIGSLSSIWTASGEAAPAMPVSPAPLVQQPDWLRRPKPEELIRVMPTEAVRRGTDGAAVISCSVSAEGALYACEVVSETPAGLGFGAAALALAPQFRMRPMMVDGRPSAGGQVRIPINWKLKGSSPDVGDSKIASNIPWLKAPSFDEVLASYPTRGREAGVSGRALLTCTYRAIGRLTSCETTLEEPKGYGFASASKSLVHSFEGPPLGEKLKREHIVTQVPFTFAAETLRGEKRVGKPTWLLLPTAEEMIDTYPPNAKANLARVTLACSVIEGGLVGGCAVVREQPDAEGFGAAALKLSRRFRMTLWTDEGLPTVGGAVRIPVRYEVVDSSKASTSPPAKP